MSTATTTAIVVGMLATADGLTATTSLTQGRHGPELRRSGYYAPADAYDVHQRAEIPVDVDHAGPPIGTVTYLEHRQRGLWAVLEVDDEALDEFGGRRFYLSAEYEHGSTGMTNTRIRLAGVGIVDHSATVGKDRAEIVDTTIEHRSTWVHQTPHRSLLERAADYHASRRYRHADHVIADRRPRPEITHVTGDLWIDGDGNPLPVTPVAHRTASTGRPIGLEIEFRPGRILSVR